MCPAGGVGVIRIHPDGTVDIGSADELADAPLGAEELDEGEPECGCSTLAADRARILFEGGYVDVQIPRDGADSVWALNQAVRQAPFHPQLPALMQLLDVEDWRVHGAGAPIEPGHVYRVCAVVA